MSDTQGWAAPGQVPPDRDQTVPPDATTGPPAYGPPPWQGAYGSPQPPYGSPPAPRLEYRPGVVPLRPLGLGEIWGGVFAAVRGNPGATLGLALLTTAVVLVPTTALAVWVAGQDFDLTALLGPGYYEDRSVLNTAGYNSMNDLFSALIASYLPVLAIWVTSFLLPVFMALVIGHAIRGGRVTAGETWRQSRGRIPSAIGTVLLTFAMSLAVVLVIGLAIALVVVAGLDGALTALAIALIVLAAVVLLVFLWVRLGFAIPVVVLERAGPATAIGRSWRLTRRGQFWRIFGIRFLTSIVASIAASIAATPISLIPMVAMGDPASGTTGMAWLFPLSQAFSVLVQAVLVTPFVAGVDSLLYIDQRIRREGLDLQIMQELHAPQPA